MATTTFKIDIVSATAIPEDNIDRIAIIRAIATLHAYMPLVRFRVREELTPPPPAGFKAFTYHLECVDGRLWDETHSYHDPPNGQLPYMDVKAGTYPNLADLGERIDEIALQRPLRDLVFKLVPAFGITDLHARWV